MNLCTDQLLLLLAPRERIVSLSHLVADPVHSPLAAQAQGLHLNHGQAEELLPRQPDLVLGGQFSATLASNLLQRFGLPVLRLGVPDAYVPHGDKDRLLAGLGLDADGIAAAVRKAVDAL